MWILEHTIVSKSILKDLEYQNQCWPKKISCRIISFVPAAPIFFVTFELEIDVILLFVLNSVKISKIKFLEIIGLNVKQKDCYETVY